MINLGKCHQGDRSQEENLGNVIHVQKIISAHCLKITEKFSKMASEASYVYILNGRLLWSNSVTRRSVLKGQKLAESAKLQMRHFILFSNNVKL